MSLDMRKCVFGVNANCGDPGLPMEVHSLIRNLANFIVFYSTQWFSKRTDKVLFLRNIREHYTSRSMDLFYTSRYPTMSSNFMCGQCSLRLDRSARKFRRGQEIATIKELSLPITPRGRANRPLQTVYTSH